MPIPSIARNLVIAICAGLLTTLFLDALRPEYDYSKALLSYEVVEDGMTSLSSKPPAESKEEASNLEAAVERSMPRRTLSARALMGGGATAVGCFLLLPMRRSREQPL